jgi:uncharacterized protein YdgA (DUF945 family)
MKKAIVVVVVVIALLALGLPRIIGGSTQTNLEAHIAQLDENPVLALRVAEYDRGWFSSRALVEIALDESYLEILDAAAQADFDDEIGAGIFSGTAISVNVDLAHGPVAFLDGICFCISAVHARLDDSDATVAMLTNELGMPYLAELDGRVSYGGTFSFTSNIPPIEYLDESGQLSFSGLTADGTLSGPDLQFDANAQRLLVDADGSTAAFENFSFNGDSSRINHIIWAGDFSATLERVSIADALTGSGSIDIGGLRMEGNVDLNDTGELLEATMTYAADSVSVPQEELALSDTELTVRFANLSVAAVTDYYELMLNFDVADPTAAAMALPPVITRLLENNPSVAIDPIRFTLNDESLVAAVSLRTVNGDRGSIDLTNPMQLLGMFEASANLTAAKPLLESLATQAAMAQLGTLDDSQIPSDQDLESMAEAQTQLMIATFLGQGYILDDGENYTTEIEYSNGEVRVNGMPLPLGALLQ